MKMVIALSCLAVVVCGGYAAAAETPSVKDGKSGVTVRIKDDGRTLIAEGRDGKAVWEADVIKAAGAPKVGQAVVRSLTLEGGNVRAVYGKHSFADFDLGTGKLIASGSD